MTKKTVQTIGSGVGVFRFDIKFFFKFQLFFFCGIVAVVVFRADTFAIGIEDEYCLDWFETRLGMGQSQICW